MRIPFLDPMPTPTIIAMGVAKPNEHGHATTMTVTECINAFGTSDEIKYHITNVNIATKRTNGTK